MSGVDIDNQARRCAFLGFELSKYAAASKRHNTNEFLDELMVQIETVQDEFNKLVSMEKAWRKDNKCVSPPS